MRRRRRTEPTTWRHVTLDLARLLVMLVVTVLLQTTVAPHIRVLGASPDVALVAVVCVGLLRGPEAGAVFGFLAGAGISFAVFGPLGLSSLVLVVVGYVAGRYAEAAATSSGLAPIIVVLGGTALGEVLYSLVQFLLDHQVPFSFFFTRVFVPVIVLNTLLAAPGYLLARLWLGEGVADGPQPA
jgi:rod shape-determining protein MreD